MSWWDSASGFTNLASAALKTAQKRIDKVLDIKEEEGGEGGGNGGGSSSYTPETIQAASSPSADAAGQDSFFESWLPSTDSGVSSMFLSPKSNADTSPSSTTAKSSSGTPSSAATLSLKDKLEKKRAARAAKKNAMSGTRLTPKESSLGGEKKVQTLGSHPQSAFTAVKNETPVAEAVNEEVVAPKVDTLFSSAKEESAQEGQSTLNTEPVKISETASSESPASELNLPVQEDNQEIICEKVADFVDSNDREAVTEDIGLTNVDLCEDSVKKTESVNSVELECEHTENPQVDSNDFDQIIPKSEDNVCAGEPETIAEPVSISSNAEERPPPCDETDTSTQPDISTDCAQQSQEAGEGSANEAINEPTDSEPLSDTPLILQESQGSGWDDVSLSILSESQMSTREAPEPVPAEAVQSQEGEGITDIPNAADQGLQDSKLEASWDKTAMESSSLTDTSLEVVSRENAALESSATTDASLEVVTRDQVALDTGEEDAEELAGQMEEGGDWNNEDMSVSLELENQQTETKDATDDSCTNTEHAEVESSDLPLAEETNDSAQQQQVIPEEQEFLADTGNKDRSMEESSNSETIDELSESNRTLTGEDIEQSRASSEATEEPSTAMSEETTEDTATVEEASKDSEEKTESKETGTEEGEGGDSKTGSPQSHLSSSSYVKSMLEEAMVESVKDTDSHTDSHSSSDMVRIESGHTSGHTSADEIDTTTSSDIEIISHISTPTPNGDGLRIDRPFDLSPLRHALSRSVRRGSPPGHKRSDSSSSGQSYQSRNGDELLSPDSLHHRDHDQSEQRSEGRKDSRSEGHDAAVAEHNNPLETEKLLKEPKGSTLQPIEENSEQTQVENSASTSQPNLTQGDLPQFPDLTDLKASLDNRDLAKKLAEVSEVLDAREKKLVSLSQENMSLVEANTILRNQLQQAEEAREAEMEDLNTLSEEFTQRIGEMEKTLQTALREKEAVKKKLREAELEIVKRSDNTATERVLKEKEQVIAELLEEGEKLSKQQLQSNNIIKKLRAKEKENESLLKTMRQKTEDQKTEVERLEQILDTKVENEKAQNEAIAQLNLAVTKQEAEIHRLNSELEDSQERCRSMKVTLDNSYKEISELHRAKASHASEAQKAALSAEMQAKEELKVTLEEFQVMARRQQEGLITQVEDLQLSMSRMEKEQGRREDVLRQEISDLQQRLQEAECRNQELTQSVTAATRPLLRQIENLQSTYTAQSDSYEKVERNLTERLADAQAQLASAQEKERLGGEKVLEATMRLATLESQVTNLRQEKSRLQAQLEMERAKVEVLEEAKTSDSAQMESLIQAKDKEISELKKEKVLVEHQLEMEKMKVESEKKKLAMAHEQLRDKELALQTRAASITPPGHHSREGSVVVPPESPMNMSLQSLTSSMNLSQSEDMLEKSLLMAASTNGNKMSLYDSLRQTSATALVENLQAQLKQREGEIVQLQNDISELEKTREAMARELVNLCTDKEQLESTVEDLTVVQKQHQDLDQRYQALLQMYGEKVEEVQELRLDLQDIKDMYKAQINELLMSK